VYTTNSKQLAHINALKDTSMHPSNHRPSLSPPPKMATQPSLAAASGVHTVTAVWPARPLGSRLSDTLRHVHVAAIGANTGIEAHALVGVSSTILAGTLL